METIRGQSSNYFNLNGAELPQRRMPVPGIVMEEALHRAIASLLTKASACASRVAIAQPRATTI